MCSQLHSDWKIGIKRGKIFQKCSNVVTQSTVVDKIKFDGHSPFDAPHTRLKSRLLTVMITERTKVNNLHVERQLRNNSGVDFTPFYSTTSNLILFHLQKLPMVISQENFKQLKFGGSENAWSSLHCSLFTFCHVLRFEHKAPRNYCKT